MKAFFAPASVAVVGANDKPGAVGRIVTENLLKAKDKRRIYPVNPNKETLFDIKCYPSISALPEPPDLVIIATRAESVPDAVEECGRLGVKAIIIISAGFKEIGAEGKAKEDRIAAIARQYGIRIIGPNCLGVIKPDAGLNATFYDKIPRPGNVTFLSQSGALGTAVLDWATSQDIGFSSFVSLGSMLDVDFGDLIDYFGEDPDTRSIIIYMESIGAAIKNARRFMSAARGFARNKPIIVLKPGKFPESTKAAMSHTGAMVGEDANYDAAFNRAGVVRVDEIEDLFSCAAILNTAYLPKDPRLAIITNAGGPGVLATDALLSRGGQLAKLSEETMAALNKALPPTWSHGNPIDVIGDATTQRFINAVETAIADPGVGGIVLIFVPQAVTPAADLAKAIVEFARTATKPLLMTMMGGNEVAIARRLLYENRVPAYEFPEDAIKTYLYMYRYARSLQLLYETPEELPVASSVSSNYLRVIVRNALKEGRPLLSEEESKKVLAAYGIPTTVPHLARSADEAAMMAARVGYPVVMKIASPDISHKSDVGGVVLNLTSAPVVKAAFDDMMKKVKKAKPKADIKGVTVQKMVTGYDHELIIGSKKDPVLGPVIVFGLGGTATEFFKDVAVGLPPLNQTLARRLIEQTRIYKPLAEGFRNKPPVNLLLLDEVLVKVSSLIVDFPEIKELDINPLVVGGNSVTALDARIVLDENVTVTEGREHEHLIVSPYPTRYVQTWQAKDGRTLTVRPIRPEDETIERELIAGLSPEAMRFRFFHPLKDITHEMLTRFCNIDYEREMAFVAEYGAGGKRRNVGVGRLITNPTGDSGEFAVLVAEDFQGKGLGTKLADMLIGIAREKGLKSIYGVVLADNVRMLELAKKLGFTTRSRSTDEVQLMLELK